MPKNGKILKVEKDTFGVDIPTPDKEYITKAEAKAIAFEHAGVKEADAKKVRVEFDFDDGVAEYSVEFHADKFDYDYEIDAVSGKILKVRLKRTEILISATFSLFTGLTLSYHSLKIFLNKI